MSAAAFVAAYTPDVENVTCARCDMIDEHTMIDPFFPPVAAIAGIFRTSVCRGEGGGMGVIKCTGARSLQNFGDGLNTYIELYRSFNYLIQSTSEEVLGEVRIYSK